VSKPLTILDRAKIFFFFTAVGSATNVVGPIICASLMRQNIWYPIWLALALQGATISAAFALPETLNGSENSTCDRSAAASIVSEGDSFASVSPPPAKTASYIYTEVVASVKALAIIFGDWRMAVLAGLYPVRMMYVALLDLLLGTFPTVTIGHWQTRHISYLFRHSVLLCAC
jgi:hypothetical protein